MELTGQENGVYTKLLTLPFQSTLPKSYFQLSAPVIEEFLSIRAESGHYWFGAIALHDPPKCLLNRLSSLVIGFAIDIDPVWRLIRPDYELEPLSKSVFLRPAADSVAHVVL